MRHRKKLAKLGRKRDYRRGLLRNLMNDLLLHGRLKTTEVKAKALRQWIDRVIVIGKQGASMPTIRKLQQYGIRETASRKLFAEYVPRYGNRKSGFTTISPVKLRKGDNALLIQISLI